MSWLTDPLYVSLLCAGICAGGVIAACAVVLLDTRDRVRVRVPRRVQLKSGTLEPVTMTEAFVKAHEDADAIDQVGGSAWKR